MKNFFRSHGISKTLITTLFFSLILAVMTFVGLIYDTIANADTTIGNFIKSHVTETLFLLLCLISGFYFLLGRFFRKESPSIPIEKVNQVKVLAIYFSIILVCYLPYLIICYPCSSYGWDYHWQLLQGSGVLPLSEHHPIVGSIVYGLLYKIGFSVGGAEIGLFFTGLCQVLLMSFSLAFALSTLRYIGCHKHIVICILVLASVCPVFATHAVWLIKDSIYSSLMVLLYSLVLNISWSVKNRRKHDQRIIRFLCSPANLIVVSLFVTMYRTEAIIITSLIFLILIYQIYKQGAKKALKKTIIVMMSFLIMFLSFKIFVHFLNIYPTSASEGLSMLSAQLVNSIRQYPDETSAKDLDVLSEIYQSDLSTVTSNYSLYNRDKIKPLNTDSNHVKSFLTIWLHHGIMRPGLYLDTFLRGSEGYWWPFYAPFKVAHCTPLFGAESDFANDGRKNTQIGKINIPTRKSLEHYGWNTETTIGEYVTEHNSDLQGTFTVKSAFPEIRDKLKDLLNTLKTIPIIQLIFIPGFYTYIALISMGYLFLHKRWAFFQSLPILIILATDCISPVNGYMRYFLPFALCSLLMLGLCFTPENARPINNQRK